MNVIFYGKQKFDMELFNPISNSKYSYIHKPYGGLWTSPVDSEYGWKEWCKNENFHLGEIKTDLTLINPRLLILDEYNDRYLLEPYRLYNKIDFVEIKNKFDAIYLTKNGAIELYWVLYGWDCECVLILNKDVIKNNE